MVGSTHTTGPSLTIQRYAASWLGSLVVHLLAALALVWVVTPSPESHGEKLAIELVGRMGVPAEATFVAVADQSPPEAAATPLDERPLVDERWAPTISELPLAVELPRATPAQRAGGRGEARGASGSGKPLDLSFAYGHTELFGVPGEGFRFVYVFDRSGSMGGSGRSALEVAKAELLTSLKPLESTHQFQIIFYNEEPRTFDLAGNRGRLVFANAQNKQSAAEYIEGIVASGSTRHEDALAAALVLMPDVIYFLTDADEPAMTEAELDRLARRNGGQSVIHAIEFGLGPGGKRENFLTRLARDNGGRHVYVDFSSWRSRPEAAGPGVAPDRPR